MEHHHVFSYVFSTLQPSHISQLINFLDRCLSVRPNNSTSKNIKHACWSKNYNNKNQPQRISSRRNIYRSSHCSYCLHTKKNPNRNQIKMSFYGGLLVGITVGICLMFSLARFQYMRSKQRSDLAKAVAAFARITVEDSKKILSPEDYPPWLNWLNVQLEKIWPFINEAASELIRNSVEPILEQYRPPVLDSMKFSKLTLGTVAPKFTGVSIIEEESNNEGVTMELEMQWDGNPEIKLDIKTLVGVALPVQVKDIAFTGVFRLIFKPLVDEFPAFGAVSYSLRHKKLLDFTLKIGGGDVSTVPGIKDAIEETIRDAIEDSITWPARKIVPILEGDYSDLELKPVGTLEVKLVQAKELANKDLIGKSDPFVVLFVRPLRDQTKRSKTIKNELNPVWNENFEFTVEEASTQHLTVRVFDDEGISASELIGCAQLQLKDLEPGKVKDVWLNLVKDLEGYRATKYRGQVHLELLYCPYGVKCGLANPFDPDYALTILEKSLNSGTDKVESNRTRNRAILRGVLSVTVISAEDLPKVDLTGKADPFVVIKLKKSDKECRTRVVNRSLNPVWNQTFDFVVEDSLHEMLTLEVWDHDTFGKEKIGTVNLTLTKVIVEGELHESFPLDGAKSGKLHLHLKWTAQPKFRETY